MGVSYAVQECQSSGIFAMTKSVIHARAKISKCKQRKEK
jgi:hypothetical protein